MQSEKSLNSTFNTSHPNDIINESFTHSQADTLYFVCFIIQGISMLMCFAVVAVFFFALVKCKDVAGRVTFKLTALVALCEALYSGSQIFNILYRTASWACNFGLLSALLSLCIGINLYIVFIYERMRGNSIVKYAVLSLITSLVFSLPPLFLGGYSYDEDLDICWYTYSKTRFFNPLEWYTLYVPLCIICCISFFIVLEVIWELKYKQKELSTQIYMFEHEGTATPSAIHEYKKAKTILSRLVSRLMFYPLVPFFGQLFNIISDAARIVGPRPFGLYVLSFLGTSLQGFFTGILFFTLDPTFFRIKSQLTKKRRIEKESQTDFFMTNMSENNTFANNNNDNLSIISSQNNNFSPRLSNDIPSNGDESFFNTQDEDT
ncbi:hypothetical protein HDU92_005026, partial [Lobulomyces angularis]